MTLMQSKDKKMSIFVVYMNNFSPKRLNKALRNLKNVGN